MEIINQQKAQPCRQLLIMVLKKSAYLLLLIN